jgi:hypothetical protein
LRVLAALDYLKSADSPGATASERKCAAFWLLSTKRRYPMCDYSLHLVASRPAKVGDELVSTKFDGTFTRGFAAIGEPKIAVCLLPGTELAFVKEVEYESEFYLLWRRKRIAARVAQFRQVNRSQPAAHRDALQFPSGQIVLVTQLCPGQMATVLQLPASEANAELASVEEERSVLRV